MDSYTDELLKKTPVQKEVEKKKARGKKKKNKTDDWKNSEIESEKC